MFLDQLISQIKMDDIFKTKPSKSKVNKCLKFIGQSSTIWTKNCLPFEKACSNDLQRGIIKTNDLIVNLLEHQINFFRS